MLLFDLVRIVVMLRPLNSSTIYSRKLPLWQEIAGRKSTGYETDLGITYRADRIERAGNISEFKDRIDHGFSFIKDVIPRLILLNPGRKIRVLDLGGGAGFFAEQIRKEFPDQVRVYTTGLRKDSARVERLKSQNRVTRPFLTKEGYWIPDLRAHQDDLKWRSIFELSPESEFDLIIDTRGEMYYGSRSNDDIEAYIFQIASKLMPGGLFSIEDLNKWSWDYDINQFLASLDDIRFRSVDKSIGYKIVLQRKISDSDLNKNQIVDEIWQTVSN